MDLLTPSQHVWWDSQTGLQWIRRPKHVNVVASLDPFSLLFAKILTTSFVQSLDAILSRPHRSIATHKILLCAVRYLRDKFMTIKTLIAIE